MGLIATMRQRRAVQQLLSVNRALAGQRLVSQLEQVVRNYAESCFERFEYRPAASIKAACPQFQRMDVVYSGFESRPVDGVDPRVVEDIRLLPKWPLRRMTPLSYASPPAQLFYCAVEDLPSGQKVLVLTADLEFIKRETLPDAERYSSLHGVLIPSISASTRGREAIHFPTLFPFWQLIADAPSPGSELKDELFVLSTMIVATGLVLLAAVVVYSRTSMRELLLSRERTRFVGAVSHAFRTPLAHIRLCADLLWTERPQTERERYCRTIFGETEVLARRVDLIMQFARSECGKRQYQFAPGDLREPVERALAQTSAVAERGGIRVSKELPEEPVAANFDGDAVQEAVVDLLENAAKYAGAGRAIRVTLRREEAAAVISVSDYGPGIPKPIQKRIFEPFFRAVRHDAAGGFGLGLYLARQTMLAHHGFVKLDSDAGRGATFHLRFPLI